MCGHNMDSYFVGREVNIRNGRVINSFAAMNFSEVFLPILEKSIQFVILKSNIVSFSGIVWVISRKVAISPKRCY
jgi:hypothetical protein